MRLAISPISAAPERACSTIVAPTGARTLQQITTFFGTHPAPERTERLPQASVHDILDFTDGGTEHRYRLDQRFDAKQLRDRHILGDTLRALREIPGQALIFLAHPCPEQRVVHITRLGVDRKPVVLAQLGGCAREQLALLHVHMIPVVADIPVTQELDLLLVRRMIATRHAAQFVQQLAAESADLAVPLQQLFDDIPRFGVTFE